MSLFENGTIEPGRALVHANLDVVGGVISFSFPDQRNPRSVVFCPNYEGLAIIEKELVVWVDQPGVIWDNSNRVLSCDDDLDGQSVTVQFRVGDGITVVCLSRGKRTKLNPTGVFVEMVKRFATPKNGVWYYPSLPVVGNALKYVDLDRGVDSEPKALERKIRWQIPFCGGVSASLELEDDESGNSAFSSLGKPESTQEIAVWPSRTIGDPWKFYSVYLGGQLKDRDVRFWTQDVTGQQLRLVSESADDKILHYGSVYTLRLKSPSKVILLEVGDGSGSERSAPNGGIFPLIGDLQNIGQSVRTIVLDFGTSNTAGAINIGQQGENLDFGRPGNAAPKVLVGTKIDEINDTAVLTTKLPWIPTVRSDMARSIRDPGVTFTEIPTALYKLAGNQWRNGAPFQSFGLGNPSVEMRRDEGIEWKTGIKWSDDPEGHTESFLTTLLIWVAGLYSSDISGIALAATYPLAFDTNRRKSFVAAIDAACQRVVYWTGFPVNSLKPGPLAVDEGTALQFLGNRLFVRCAVNEKETSKLVLTADIGGGTFDLSLCVEENNSFRILAADSVKFGAELIINALEENTNNANNNASSSRDEKELRRLISRTVREGLLDDVMSASKDMDFGNDEPWKAGTPNNLRTYLKFPSWKSTSRESAKLVNARSNLFFYLLAEYASRFVAGTLLDVDALKYRLINAPGNANFSPDNPTYTRLMNNGPAAIAVVLGGNGWRFLSRDVASMTFELWQTLVAERTMKLLMKSRELIWRVEWAWPEDLPNGKGATSLGAVRAIGSALALNAGIDVEAAPNGFDDLVQQVEPNNWWVQVGPGSRFADGGKLAPFSEHGTHQGTVACPAFSFDHFALHRSAKDLLNQHYNSLIGDPRTGAVADIREQQNVMNADRPYRAIPTIRLLWDRHLHKLVSEKSIT